MIILRLRWKRFFFRWWAAPSRMRRCSPGSSRFQGSLRPLATVAVAAFCQFFAPSQPRRGAGITGVLVHSRRTACPAHCAPGSSLARQSGCSSGKSGFARSSLLAMFLVWQLAPILFEGYSSGLNFREVARYPVSFRVYFLLSLAYGVSDPAAITCMFWLFSIWLGGCHGAAWPGPSWPRSPSYCSPSSICFSTASWLGCLNASKAPAKAGSAWCFLMFILILLPQVLQFATGYWTNFRVLKLLPAWVLDGAHAHARAFASRASLCARIALPGNSGLSGP